MSQLPANLAQRSRRSVLTDAVQGLGSSRGAHISIRGGRFRLIDAKGVEKLVDTHYLDLIIIDANDKPARIYFEGTYSPDSDEPPACWSDNGVGPSTQAMSPQWENCATCPKAVRGTKMTFNGKPTSACENRKKVAAIIPDDPAINVYEFQIPPGSLTNFRNYCQFIASQATGGDRAADIADFVTRVAFDPDKQFVMTFQPTAWADDERTLQVIEYIDANRLSDQAVGRNDVALEPEQVRAMLAGRPQQQAIAAPAPKPAAQPQTFALPPRQPVLNQAPAAPAAQEAPPAAPAPRSRKAKEQPALPPSHAPSAATQPAVTGGSASTDVGEIPAFLRRTTDNAPSAVAAPPPRFGVGQPPAPPPEIADALAKAMSLPTRSA